MEVHTCTCFHLPNLCLLVGACNPFRVKVIIDMYVYEGFPGNSDGKESACSVGDLDLIPGLGRSPGEGKGYPMLAWKIPWTVYSMGSQRVRHD